VQIVVGNEGGGNGDGDNDEECMMMVGGRRVWITVVNE